jgi:NADH-quinone oxidoreductase subunit K
MIVPYGDVLILALILFLLGALCTVLRRSLIMIFIGVEIMLNAAGIVFVGASLKWRQMDGQAFVLFVMAVAAAEVAIGLALMVYGQRRTGSIAADRYNRLKG